MRLRSFIVIGSIILVGITLVVFSGQTEKVFQVASKEIDRKQIEQLSSVAKTFFQTRFALLRSFVRTIRTDNDLASAFVLARENRDFHGVKERLNKIKQIGGFDFAEIYPLNQGKLLEKFPLKSDLKDGGSLVVVDDETTSRVLYLDELVLYGEKVGLLALGYKLEGVLKTEIQEISQSAVGIRPLLLENQALDQFQSGSSSLVVIPLNSQQSLGISLKPQQPAAQNAEHAIRKRMLVGGLLTLVLLGGFVFILLEFGFVRKFEALVRVADRLAESIDSGQSSRISTSRAWVTETTLLAKVLNKLADSLSNYRTLVEKQALLEAEARNHQALAHLASQVAHDIRSPLVAMETVVKSLTGIPEPQRIILKNAYRRINDIANNLLAQKRSLVKSDPQSTESKPGVSQSPAISQNRKTRPELLCAVLDSIVSEKRTEFSAHKNLLIETEIEAGVYGIFSMVHSCDLKAIVSNLMNNSVEVLKSGGCISVGLSEGDNTGTVKIVVCDNGPGISPAVLEKLGKEEVSFGKEQGNGIGIMNARRTVERWGGRLTIESAMGKGTTVSITLPKVSPPAWFPQTVAFPKAGKIVVLDDDQSIHDIWRSRINALSEGFQIVDLYNAEDFCKWMTESPPLGDGLSFLIDYELLGSNETGLDLIERFGLSGWSFLVTSRYEEEGILSRCLNLGQKLLPKNVAAWVPIKVTEKIKQPDCVLIDDDPLVHATWSIVAQQKGKHLLTFDSPEAFEAESVGTLVRSVPVYVDLQLAGGRNGSEYAKSLVSQGFTKVHIATGMDPEQVRPGLKIQIPVVGKAAPWVG